MALRFKATTAVAVGTFNIYVIQPTWLTEIGEIEQGKQVRIEAAFDRPGFRFSMEGGSLRWDVRPDRLIVESTSPHDDCGSRLATILKMLPWTPLSGIGVNVEFEGSESDVRDIPATCQLPSCHAPVGYEAKQRTVHIAVEKNDQVFNSQLSISDKVELTLNVHTELKGKGKQEQMNRIATEVCRQFFVFRDEAMALARHFFTVELSDERNID